VYGWLRRAKPLVSVLTDGSGQRSAPRVAVTGALLQSIGASPGTIFGRLTDREVYRLILERNTPLLASLVTELAGGFVERGTKVVLCDAVEGYNPAHDLCRLIVGAAIASVQTGIRQYEYAVVGGPDSFDSLDPGAEFLDLSEEVYEKKLRAARGYSTVLNDVGEMLARYGAEAFRRESFRPVDDWTQLTSGEPPQYERLGAERVAAGSYGEVIRQGEHMIPLRDSLCAWLKSVQCVS
jgi:hypothetical protein